MSGYLAEPAVSSVSAQTAILLINLGSPETPTTPAVKRYLGEFLADPRIVEMPRALWWLILNGLILPTRAKKSAEKYASIWTPEGSPLKVHTEKQVKLLRGYLGQAGHHVVVAHAMRYGEPSIADTLTRLKAAGCTRILLLPLYPQYSAPTTATACDAAFTWLQKTRNQPELRIVRSFADDPAYIAALAASVREHWMRQGRPDSSSRLIMSFHGMPCAMAEKGDPYPDECQHTARLLAKALDLGENDYLLCFQSRFGRGKWLQPDTAATLSELGKQGIRRVDLICPGFPADCLETLEEIALAGKTDFLQAGGQEFHYIPALNERDDWIHALSKLAIRHLQGWPTSHKPSTTNH